MQLLLQLKGNRLTSDRFYYEHFGQTELRKILLISTD